jgi:WD40 repeat protein
MWSAAFSPDGTRIVTASQDNAGGINTARIWDAATAKEIMVFHWHADPVSSAAFSPDGKRIVTASHDNTARIWDVSTGKEIVVLRGHEGGVWSAAFSPDGTRIVTADYKTARIWHAATGKEIAVLRGHEDLVRSAVFSPDGKRIVTASHDNTARIWDVHLATMSTKDLVAEACTRRLRPGLTKLNRDEMRLAGYDDITAEIDVCTGVE